MRNPKHHKLLSGLVTPQPAVLTVWYKSLKESSWAHDEKQGLDRKQVTKFAILAGMPQPLNT